MNLLEARENIRACVALCGGCDKDTQGGPCHAREKGFLEALQCKEVKGLVEALRFIINHAHSMELNGIGTPFSRSFSDLSKEALSQWEKAVDKE